MVNLCFEKVFVSELKYVKAVIEENMSFIRKNIADISTDDFYDLKLIFNELVINAVIHGNKNNTEGFVALYTKICDGNIIEAVIKDQGEGYDYNSVLKNKSQKISFDEHGRGVKLAASLTDKIAFNETGNEVKFIKKVSLDG